LAETYVNLTEPDFVLNVRSEGVKHFLIVMNPCISNLLGGNAADKQEDKKKAWANIFLVHGDSPDFYKRVLSSIAVTLTRLTNNVIKIFEKILTFDVVRGMFILRFIDGKQLSHNMKHFIFR
jgi:hypothetical protein